MKEENFKWTDGLVAEYCNFCESDNNRDIRLMSPLPPMKTFKDIKIKQQNRKGKTRRITKEWLAAVSYEIEVIDGTQTLFYFDPAKRFYLIFNEPNVATLTISKNMIATKFRINTEPDDNWITDVSTQAQLKNLYNCLTGQSLKNN